MHRHFRCFQVQKRRVHRGQLLGVSHIFLPQTSRGALLALLAFRRSWVQDVMIVHFPEAHMQWQTAPIGQIA
jgi:hypothetical protein